MGSAHPSGVCRSPSPRDALLPELGRAGDGGGPAVLACCRCHPLAAPLLLAGPSKCSQGRHRPHARPAARPPPALVLRLVGGRVPQGGQLLLLLLLVRLVLVVLQGRKGQAGRWGHATPGSAASRNLAGAGAGGEPTQAQHGCCDCGGGTKTQKIPSPFKVSWGGAHPTVAKTLGHLGWGACGEC